MQVADKEHFRRLICWRVLKENTKHVLQHAAKSTTVPYACISTGIFLPAVPQGAYTPSPSVAFLPVPVLVPMWGTADGPSVGNVKALGLKALAQKVSAVMRRWGVLQNVGPNRCA